MTVQEHEHLPPGHGRPPDPGPDETLPDPVPGHPDPVYGRQVCPHPVVFVGVVDQDDFA